MVDMDILKQRFLILIFGLSNFLFFYLLLNSIDLNIFLMTRLNFSILHLQIIKPLIMLLMFLSIAHLLNNTSLYQGLSWGKPSKQSFVFLALIIIAYAASYYLTPKEPFVTDFTKGLSHEIIGSYHKHTMVTTFFRLSDCFVPTAGVIYRSGSTQVSRKILRICSSDEHFCMEMLSGH